MEIRDVTGLSPDISGVSSILVAVWQQNTQNLLFTKKESTTAYYFIDYSLVVSKLLIIFATNYNKY